MIKVWEKISDKKLTSLSNFKTLEFILKYENIKMALKRIVKKLFFKNSNSSNRNTKFSSLNNYVIKDKVKRFKTILRIKKK